MPYAIHGTLGRYRVAESVGVKAHPILHGLKLDMTPPSNLHERHHGPPFLRAYHPLHTTPRTHWRISTQTQRDQSRQSINMAMTQRPPELNIPHSNSIVHVSILNTTSHISIPSAYFVQPPVPGFEDLDACAYSFLIKRSNTATKTKYDTLVFDLGIRTDPENGPKDIVEELNTNPAVNLSAKKDMATILREKGQALEDIGGIIWSHWHFDHTGDPATFPS